MLVISGLGAKLLEIGAVQQFEEGRAEHRLALPTELDFPRLTQPLDRPVEGDDRHEPECCLPTPRASLVIRAVFCHTGTPRSLCGRQAASPPPNRAPDYNRDPDGALLERTIDIRWRDLDPLGHVNNAVYATYLEEARDRWLMQTLEGITPITDFALVRVAIDYKSEIVFDDLTVTSTCRPVRIGNSSVTTAETVTKPGGAIAASAEAVIVVRDVEAGRSRPLRPDERTALEKQIEAS